MLVFICIISFFVCINCDSITCASYNEEAPTILTRDTTEPETNECPATGIHFLINPGSCTSFFICRSGVKFEQECADELNFDSDKLNCNFEDQANCLRDLCPSDNDPNKLQFVQRQGVTCSPKFFICDAGAPVEQSCLDSLLWNPESERCMMNSDVDNCENLDVKYSISI